MPIFCNITTYSDREDKFPEEGGREISKESFDFEIDLFVFLFYDDDALVSSVKE